MDCWSENIARIMIWSLNRYGVKARLIELEILKFNFILTFAGLKKIDFCHVFWLTFQASMKIKNEFSIILSDLG